MTPRYLGERVLRNEDARLLTGRALFVDDVQLPGILHVAFVRSNYAHARVRGVDVSAAIRKPGVVAVYTASDLGDYWRPGPLLVPPPPIEGLVFHLCTQVPLAKDKVRHVGEPIAMVVAESRYLAEDAIEEILVDLEPLDAVVDLESALTSSAALDMRTIGRMTRSERTTLRTMNARRNTPTSEVMNVRNAWSAFASGTDMGTEMICAPTVSPSFQPNPFAGP